MALNPLHHSAMSSTSPANGSFPITPNDGADLATNIRAVTIGTAGTLAWVDTYSGATHSTRTLPAGTYPLFARRILATGTTAAALTGWI